MHQQCAPALAAAQKKGNEMATYSHSTLITDESTDVKISLQEDFVVLTFNNYPVLSNIHITSVELGMKVVSELMTGLEYLAERTEGQ